MQIVKPSVALEYITPYALEIIEAAGRTCYKSEDHTTTDSAGRFVQARIAAGHRSILEHATAIFRIVCDRGVSHEIVRHRIASYSQESTRYCRYSGELQVIEPPGLDTLSFHQWAESMRCAEWAYKALLDNGHKPEIARAVLPTCTKTELVMSTNFREWLHFISLRAAEAAHPQMREIAELIRNDLSMHYPEIFNA